MRMPLAAHCASMLLFLASTTTAPMSSGLMLCAVQNDYKLGRSVRLSVSRNVPPQYEGRRGERIALWVITRPPANLGKPETSVEPASRLVILVNFENDRSHPEARKPAQVKVE